MENIDNGDQNYVVCLICLFWLKLKANQLQKNKYNHLEQSKAKQMRGLKK